MERRAEKRDEDKEGGERGQEGDVIVRKKEERGKEKEIIGERTRDKNI